MTSKSIKRALITMGFSCNNNCTYCSVAHCREAVAAKSTQEIEDSLVLMREKKCEGAELIGGEPTIRPDIVRIVRFARKIGYSEVALTTNGRMFAYDDFLKQMLDAGVSRIAISLLADTAKVHDALTRTKGSFDQTVQGIKNISRIVPKQAAVNTVITKHNVHRLNAMATMLTDLGVGTWSLLALLAEGRGKQFYRSFAPSLEDLATAFSDLLVYQRALKGVFLVDFPLCLFRDPAFQREPFSITSPKALAKVDQDGFGPEEARMDKAKALYRTHLSFCRECEVRSRCTGIWKAYHDIYGTEHIRRELFGK